MTMILRQMFRKLNKINPASKVIKYVERDDELLTQHSKNRVQRMMVSTIKQARGLHEEGPYTGGVSTFFNHDSQSRFYHSITAFRSDHF